MSLALALVILVPVVGFVAMVVLSGLFFGFDDGFADDFADDYYVEQRSVNRAMEPACETLTDAVAKVRLFGSAADGQASLAPVADAARGISTAIDGADPNSDAKKLSADWASIATALDTYAKSLAKDPEARLNIPEVDNTLVSDRISWGNDSCFVPTLIISLDPDAASAAVDPFGF